MAAKTAQNTQPPADGQWEERSVLRRERENIAFYAAGSHRKVVRKQDLKKLSIPLNLKAPVSELHWTYESNINGKKRVSKYFINMYALIFIKLLTSDKH